MNSTALQLAKLIDAKGGTAYYVGGTVRDALLGREVKDIAFTIFVRYSTKYGNKNMHKV